MLSLSSHPTVKSGTLPLSLNNNEDRQPLLAASQVAVDMAYVKAPPAPSYFEQYIRGAIDSVTHEQGFVVILTLLSIVPALVSLFVQHLIYAITSSPWLQVAGAGIALLTSIGMLMFTARVLWKPKAKLEPVDKPQPQPTRSTRF
jgi:hypothetical protein